MSKLRMLAYKASRLNSTKRSLWTQSTTPHHIESWVCGADHASFGKNSYSQKFEVLGQVDDKSSVSDSVVWDLVGVVLLWTWRFGHVSLPNCKESSSPTSENAKETSEYGGKWLMAMAVILSCDLVANAI